MSRLSNLFSFAHLGSAPKKSRAEETEDEELEDTENEQETEDTEDEEQTSDDDADSEDEEQAEDDEDEPKASDRKKAKAPKPAPAKAASIPSNPRQAYAAGRRAERERIGSILSHESAAGRVAMAAKFACNTDLDVQTVVTLLEEAPKQSASAGLDTAMRRAGNPRLGGGADDAPKDAGASLKAAVKRQAEQLQKRRTA